MVSRNRGSMIYSDSLNVADKGGDQGESIEVIFDFRFVLRKSSAHFGSAEDVGADRITCSQQTIQRTWTLHARHSGHRAAVN